MARESRHPALPGIVEQCRAELEEIDARIRPGTILGVGETIAAGHGRSAGCLPRE